VDLELGPVPLDEAREGLLVTRLRGRNGRFHVISCLHSV
jgi:hypothetical protein